MAEIRGVDTKGLNSIKYKCTICDEFFYEHFDEKCVPPSDPEPEIPTPSMEVRQTVYKALGIPVAVSTDPFFKEFKTKLPLCPDCCFNVGCLNNIRKQIDYFDKQWNELKSKLEESIQKSVDSRSESTVDRENDCDMDSLENLLDPSRLTESLRNSEVQMLRQIVYQRRHYHLSTTNSSVDRRKSHSPTTEPQNENHPQPQDIANEGLGESAVAVTTAGATSPMGAGTSSSDLWSPSNSQVTRKVRFAPTPSLHELDKKSKTIRNNYSHNKPLALISLLKNREHFSKKTRSTSDPEGVNEIQVPNSNIVNSEVVVSVNSNEAGRSGENQTQQDEILTPSSSRSTNTKVKGNPEIRSQKNSQGRFKCQYCHQTYSGLHLYYFKNHVKMHTVVGEASESSIGMQILSKPHGQAQQMKSHSEKKNSFLCDFCSASFETKTQRSSHVKDHEKPLHCKHCGKGYINETCLTIHVHRFHRSQK